jgi:hypothetical protein
MHAADTQEDSLRDRTTGLGNFTANRRVTFNGIRNRIISQVSGDSPTLICKTPAAFIWLDCRLGEIVCILLLLTFSSLFQGEVP